MKDRMERIKDMVGQSLSDKEIAKRLDCSVGTVVRCRSILGLRKRNRISSKAIDFSEVDLSRPVDDIAAELGCSRHTVSLARMKNGKARQRDIDFSDADWTKTNPELAQEYNCSVRTVWNARRRLGIEQKPRGRQTTK